MDKRVRERRSKVARGRGRRRLRLTLLALTLLALAGVFLWLRSSDVLAVQRVTVPVTTRVSEAELREATKRALGVSLLRVPIGAIEKALREVPFVRSAHVYRSFPDTLEVRILEYQPQARVQVRDGSRWLVADDGRVLQKDQGDGGSLPLFVSDEDVAPLPGKDLTSQELVAALPIAGSISGSATWTSVHPVDRIVVSSGGEVTIRLSGGAEVRIGRPTDLKQKLIVASEILDRYIRDGKSLAYVDVQVLSRVVAKPKTP